MMIDKELLDILACPETQQDLIPADAALVEKINALIEKGSLLNRAQEKVTKKIQGGLVCKDDQKYLYPIIDNIPILLTSEAIELARL